MLKTRKETIKIGNAGGYWGDDPGALKRQIMGGHLDYVSMDFLAEITMSIMQKQRSNDPKLGYARDFLGMLEEVLPAILKNKTKIITNAGGVNPIACAEAIEVLAKRLGLNPKIAIVHGDDILPDIGALRSKGCDFKNMEDAREFSTVADKVEAANVYFGAAPVVEALKWDPDIIVTGRVTDTGITVAAMIHEFGWQQQDWNKLASGIVAGHIIECGCQATGGNFTDWHLVPSFSNMGYPIIEMNSDGTFVVTKHPNTGGLVSLDTVREQLFYEMGNPKSYITPDVVADFSTIQLSSDGKDRVRVSGVKGCEPTPLYKVSMAYLDGFKVLGTICISGPNARMKAEAFAKIFWEKAGTDFVESQTEYFGWNACHRSLGHKDDGNEIILRIGARDYDQNKLKKLSKLVPALILSGPPGVCVLGGAPKPAEVVSYWPALMPKSAVKPKIALYSGGVKDERVVNADVIGHFEAKDSHSDIATKVTMDVQTAMRVNSNENIVPISEIALGRSGDKGDMANIGILARSPQAFKWLDEWLTAQRVKDLFQELCFGNVVRYRLENMSGFNFLLDASLGGGGTLTLRTDAQGKTFAQALLRQLAPVPKEVVDSVRQMGIKST
ncbi:MAG: DUF1446 domain-containing protein [Proteobacteria bacterium]|nr:DUF1446 domain-containing protein [Pseudomonadota bacterium]